MHIDLNGLVHQAIRKASNIDHAIVRLFAALDRLLEASPRKSVSLLLDGPGPLAKLHTQRSRRVKATKQQEPISRTDCSTLAVTPGTGFMRRVAEALKYFAATRGARRRWQGIRWVISDASCPGEGELKISSG